VLLKIASLGVSDPTYLKRVEALIDQQAERFALHSLVKFIILVTTHPNLRQKHRQLIIKRLRYFNQDNVTDSRLATQLLVCMPQIEVPLEQFLSFLNHIVSTMHKIFDLHDVSRILKALSLAQKLIKSKEETYEKHYEVIMERAK